MNPKKNQSGFVTYFKSDDYFFQFNDEEGRPILFSRPYQSEKSRDNSIQSVIENVGKNYFFEVQTAGKGKFLFVLKAGNHQEIGRSRLFDSREEMEEKQQLLRNIGTDVLIEDAREIAAKKPDAQKKAEKRETPQKVQEKPAESSKEIIQKVVEQTRKEDEAGQPLRYKFTVIYYPESDRWLVKMVNTDPNEKSDDFESYEGKLIGEFLKTHLPPEAVKTTTPVERPTPLPAKQEVAKKKEVSQKLPKEILEKIQEEIELTIRSFRGEEIKVSTQVFNLGQIEISPRNEEEMKFSKQPYEAKVIAKSMETNETILLGEVKDKTPRHGRFFVPVSNVNELKPGWYRLLATVHQEQEGEEQHEYHGSRILMVN